MNRQAMQFSIGLAIALAGIVLLFSLLNRNSSQQRQSVPVFETTVVDVSELFPLWDDDQFPSNDGEWPRGLSEAQIEILLHADRVLVGRVNPYPAAATEGRFHRHRVYGAVAIEELDDIDWIGKQLAALQDYAGATTEFYPPYAIRIVSNEQSLDLLLQLEGGAEVLALTSVERRYLLVDPNGLRFLEDVLKSIPVQPADNRHP